MFAPRTNKFSYRIPLFDGGLNTKYTDVNTPPNQSPDLQNVEFDDYGAVGTNNGYTKFNTAAIGSAVIDGLHGYVSNDLDREVIAACNGSIWRTSGTTFATIGSSQSLYTAGQDVKMVTVENEVYITNGYIKPYRWDSTNFFQVGVSAPTSGVVSAASQGTGALNGDYHWWMTGVNDNDVEGDYSEITSAAVTIANGQVLLTAIPDFPVSAGVVTKNIYRNTAGVTNVPYLVTAIASNVSSYTDNIADSLIATDAPSDNGTPPYCKYMLYHRGRAFSAGNPNFPMRLYYSNAGDPEIWASTSFIDVGEGDGEPITAIRIYGNSLVIHKNDKRSQGSIWLLYMPDSNDVTDDSNWYLMKSPVAYGGQSDKAIAFFSNLMFYLNRYGAFAFTGTDLAYSAADSNVGKFAVDSHSFNIEPDVNDFSVGLLDKSAMITYDNKVWMAVAKGSGATENNKIYVYDFVRASDPNRTIGAWSKLTAPGVNNFTEHDGDLLAGSATADGYVYTIDDGTNYDGSAIDSYFTTVPIPGLPEHTDYTKVFRYLEVLVTTPGDWPLSVTYWVDYYDDDGLTTTINLTNEESTWGAMVWGSGSWGAGSEKKRIRLVLQNAVGKAIKFKFRTNTADQYWKLYELDLKYNLRRIR